MVIIFFNFPKLHKLYNLQVLGTEKIKLLLWLETSCQVDECSLSEVVTMSAWDLLTISLEYGASHWRAVTQVPWKMLFIWKILIVPHFWKACGCGIDF